MRFELIVVFLSLPLLAGRELAAQNRHASTEKLAMSYYKLEALEMSDDGRWLAVSKSYDTNSDTVILFSSIKTDQPIGLRVQAEDLTFLCNDNLLMRNNQQAELFNLQKQTSLFFDRVKKIKSFNDNSMFLLHYDENEHNRLELHDSKGGLLNAINNVTEFYTCGNECVFAITEDSVGKYSIVMIKSRSVETIYTSSHKISKLDSYPGEKGLIIYEQHQDSTSQEVLYLDLASEVVFPLREVLSISIQKGFSEVIKEGETYFLKLHVKGPKTDNSLVDIWYGNDNRLEKKFCPPTIEVYFLWEPKKMRVRRIGNDIFTTSISLKNDRYFLCYNPYEFQDYITHKPQLKLFIYDVFRDSFSMLDTIKGDLYISGNGEWALCQKERDWYLYHIPSGSIELISESGLKKPWFTYDGEAVLFEGEGTLWRYELKNRKLSEVAVYKDYQIIVINGEHNGIIASKCNIFRNVVNTDKPIVIRLYNPQDNMTSYVLRNKEKSEVIVPSTPDKITSFSYSKDYEWFSWIEENYNQPPYIVLKDTGEKEQVVFKSNENDKAVLSLKQEIVKYTNSDGVSLKGILYYPLNYDSTINYPMVVHIYQIQNRKAINIYPVMTFNQGNSDGYNLRLLLENGYFVYYPDIVYGEKGTGLSALDCVNHSLDALEGNPSIDQNKIGLIGHSHGGYETNFIATQSDRFAAYISGAGNSDIIRSYFSYNYNFYCPFYFQFETGQYEMKRSFSEDKELYFKNNPIYYVDQVNAPVLLWTGMKDHNIYWEQTMEFYIGLKRNNKTVISLFYPGEGHALCSPEACKDLVSRVMDWFNYFLKGEENIEWIDKEMKEDAF